MTTAVMVSDFAPGHRRRLENIGMNCARCLAEKQRAVIARAIAGYQAKTCIRFVPKTAQDRDFIVISKLGWVSGFENCYADFARVGGRQQVSLAGRMYRLCDDCSRTYARDRGRMTTALWSAILPLAIVVVSRTSGQLTYLTAQDFRNAALLPPISQRMRPLYNDQRRKTASSHSTSDRRLSSEDVSFTSINEKIAMVTSTFYTRISFLSSDSIFDKLSTLDLTYYGETYDYLSIMHYEKNEGSRNGENTIEAKGCSIHESDGQKHRLLRV
ncbi:astacin [Ostertagia ostertagi]